MKEIIGETIKDEVRRSGLTQEQFASKMSMSLRNIANLFNKEHLPHDQLIKASKVLERDFVKDYLDYLYDSNPEVKKLSKVKEPDVSYLKPATFIHEISLQINVKGKMESIESEFPAFLRLMKKEAEQRGLQLA